MEMIRPSSVGPVALPQPRVPLTVRAATVADLPFIDALQKRHTKQVGWMPRQQLEGKVAAGHVLIAEEMQNDECRMQNEAEDVCISPSSFSIHHSAFCISSPAPAPLGYVIAADRYMKREDVGIVYQMNVEPGSRRKLVGATLLKAVFERAAYGCRLFCCWCAQDLEANRFWESVGFVPLAFRSGSAKKSRTHLFWQRRIRAGDTATPWWFPSQTSSGSIREDRIVLPIPPGTHWSDAKPVLLPQELSGGQWSVASGGESAEAAGFTGNWQRATGDILLYRGRRAALRRAGFAQA